MAGEFGDPDRDTGTEFEGGGFTGSAEFGGSFGGFGGATPGVGASTDFGDITTELEIEIDRVNRANSLFDLVNDRLGERPGRFGFTPATSFRAPEEDLLSPPSTWQNIKTWLKQKAVPYAIQRATSVIPAAQVPSFIASALYDKHALGFSDQELNDKYGRAMLDAITGGAFSAAAAFGRGAQWLAKKAGAQGNPDVSFGQDEAKAGPSDRGLDAVDVADAVSFDRGQFARQPQFSDKSVYVDKRRNTIDQLLRQAKMGRYA